ncbi:hypothetical protein PaeBR_18845 [Paenibacillus sp. BR2-3]|uniref:hypothetical protein n=1 Tax=Paenibacillus sp. BR2-3 TaxID=3048494 RepID=UPI0039779DB8
MNIKEQLEAIHAQLTQTITALLLVQDKKHITKLGLARIEIRETLICMEQEEVKQHANLYAVS